MKCIVHGILICFALNVVQSKVHAQSSETAKLIGQAALPIRVDKWLTSEKHRAMDRFEKGIRYVVIVHGYGPIGAKRLLAIHNEVAKLEFQMIVLDGRTEEEVDDYLKEKDFDIDPPATRMKLFEKIRYVADPELALAKKLFWNPKPGVQASVIIGQDGTVDWIGYPYSAGHIANEIAKGTWDRNEHQAHLRESTKVERPTAELMRLAKDPKNVFLLEKRIKKLKEEFKDLESTYWRDFFASFCFRALVEVNSEQRFDALKFAVQERGPHATALVGTLNSFVHRSKKKQKAGEKIDRKLADAIMNVLEDLAKEHPDRTDVAFTKSHLHYLLGDLKDAISTFEKLLKMTNGKEMSTDDYDRWKLEWARDQKAR